MFESTSHFDFDDDILRTSFTPSVKNTPVTPELKRTNEVVDDKIHKKLKVNKDEGIALKSILNVGKGICTNAFTSPNRVLKRKFPGPAGLLPETGASNKSILQLLENVNLENDANDDITILSQQTNSIFEIGPWKEMTTDLFAQSPENLIERFNIRWIKKQSFKHLVNHKAPFLAALIENIRITDGKIPTVSVTLKDATGDIRGTVLHTLYEKYTSNFRIGSVLVLKHFGVLSSSYNSHCLMITPNNLIAIYCPGVPSKLPHGTPRNLAEISTADGVRKVLVQEYNAEEILKKYNDNVIAQLQEKERENSLLESDRSISSEPGTSCSTKSTFDVLNKLQVNAIQACSTSSTNEDSRIQIGGKLPVSKQRVQPDDGVRPSTSRMSCERNSNINVNIEIPSTSTGIGKEHFNPVKKFNFKQFSNASKRVVNDETGNKDLKTCENVIGDTSKISVKPDSKEHAELWKNLLEDVDTDSLFDDF